MMSFRKGFWVTAAFCIVTIQTAAVAELGIGENEQATRGAEQLEHFQQVYNAQQADLIGDLPFSSSQPLAAFDMQNIKKVLDQEGVYSNQESNIENANNAILIANQNNQIVQVNFQACQLTGYRREALLAMSIQELETPGRRYTPRQDVISHAIHRAPASPGLKYHHLPHAYSVQ